MTDDGRKKEASPAEETAIHGFGLINILINQSTNSQLALPHPTQRLWPTPTATNRRHRRRRQRRRTTTTASSCSRSRPPRSFNPRPPPLSYADLVAPPRRCRPQPSLFLRLCIDSKRIDGVSWSPSRGISFALLGSQPYRSVRP
jgi:hypothetical protein